MAMAALAAPVTAHITRMSGDVSIKAESGSAWSPAKTGAKVVKGDSVKCGANASAFISWGDNTIKLNAMSVFTVIALDKDLVTEKSALKLTEGKIFARVGKLNTDSVFTIQTPYAISGVRGTAFEVTVEKFSVLEGSIFVKALDTEVIVDAGMYVDVSPEGAISQPETLPQDNLHILQQVLEECKDISVEQTTILDTGATINDVIETTTNVIPAMDMLPELLPGHGGLQFSIDISE